MEITQNLLREGYVREIMRQIQDMRKEVGYRLDEMIYGGWETTSTEVAAAINEHEKEISSNTLLKEFGRGHNSKTVFDIEKEFELGPQAKIWLGARR
jgi:hypothetical protein